MEEEKQKKRNGLERHSTVDYTALRRKYKLLSANPMRRPLVAGALNPGVGLLAGCNGWRLGGGLAPTDMELLRR